MTHFTPGLILEALLVVLLLVTVGYCVVLNSRLGRLRSSQQELRQIVSDLTLATTNAETAIRGLRTTTEEADANLSEKLHKAQLLARELSSLTGGTPRRPVSTVAPQGSTVVGLSPSAPASGGVKPDPAPVQAVPEAPSTGGGEPPASAGAASGSAVPSVDREAWRRHALSRLKRAS